MTREVKTFVVCFAVGCVLALAASKCNGSCLALHAHAISVNRAGPGPGPQPDDNPKPGICDNCNGTGKSGDGLSTCPVCNGSGRITKSILRGGGLAEPTVFSPSAKSANKVGTTRRVRLRSGRIVTQLWDGAQWCETSDGRT